MVMADGFAWNGQTYDSLSKVAFAITRTRVAQLTTCEADKAQRWRADWSQMTAQK
jgi:hypothetical protein